MKTESVIPWIFAAAIGAVLALLAAQTGFTGDLGDSITHYLYSRYAFTYPAIFFDHWAKPLFVLVSAPFAQAGFFGIQLFNITCATLTAVTLYFCALKLKLKYPLLVFAFLFGAPLYFTMSLSGLTEYLFAFLFSLALLLHLRNNDSAAICIASFLPFARSEGLLLLFVFALYLALAKKWRLLPLLLCGHIAYAITGAVFHKNVWWVFTHIPYASTGSPYGHGAIFDLVFRLNYVIEKPVYLLLVAGLAALAVKLARERKVDYTQHILIAGSFLVFFTGHSLFWTLGIFNSMGLPRVFIAIMPAVALLALAGLNAVTHRVQKRVLRIAAVAAVILAVAVFPFTPRSQGVVLKADTFHQHEKSILDSAVVPYFKKNFPDYRSRLLIYSHPYLSMALDIDHFDYLRRQDFKSYCRACFLPSGTLLIWDNWFAVVEGNTGYEELLANASYKHRQSFAAETNAGQLQLEVLEYTGDP